ncbi:MAG: colicin D domain-containing protein [Chloroflexota bacterium]
MTGARASLPPRVTFGQRQLQAKFKHAADFGISGPFSPVNMAVYRAALEAHLSSPTTQVIQGTYRGQPVSHFFDPATSLNVIVDPRGTFVSGWRLNPAHAVNLQTRGSL